MSEVSTNDFVAERDAALLSLNYQSIMAFMRRHNPAEAERLSTADKEVFWASVHKARSGATSLPMEARSDSKVWLAMRGMQSMDDGDVPWGVE